MHNKRVCKLKIWIQKQANNLKLAKSKYFYTQIQLYSMRLIYNGKEKIMSMVFCVYAYCIKSLTKNINWLFRTFKGKDHNVLCLKFVVKLWPGDVAPHIQYFQYWEVNYLLAGKIALHEVLVWSWIEELTFFVIKVLLCQRELFWNVKFYLVKGKRPVGFIFVSV